jgi:hypothetical protein
MGGGTNMWTAVEDKYAPFSSDVVFAPSLTCFRRRPQCSDFLGDSSRKVYTRALADNRARSLADGTFTVAEDEARVRVPTLQSPERYAATFGFLIYRIERTADLNSTIAENKELAGRRSTRAIQSSKSSLPITFFKSCYKLTLRVTESRVDDEQQDIESVEESEEPESESDVELVPVVKKVAKKNIVATSPVRRDSTTVLNSH